MTKKTNAVGKLLAKHRGKAVAIAAALLLPAFALAQSAGLVPGNTFNCSASGACSITIQAAEAVEDVFGANSHEITRWISGNLSDDLDVDDDLNVDGDATVTGSLSVTGAISGEYLPNITQAALVSVTTTQEICDITNSGSTPRRLLDAGAQFGTQVTGETQRVTVTSNFGGAATTGTAGANLLHDYTFDLSAASSTFAASSTAGFVTLTDSVQKTWDPGEHLVYMVGSPTTTLTGTCYATWVSF